MKSIRVLVTGAGGIAGVNFVRALKFAGYYVAGTDYDRYYIELADLDSRYATPRHDEASFVSRIVEIAKMENVKFIHPQPSSEALVLSRAAKALPAPTFLPDPVIMEVCQDKLATQLHMKEGGVAVARTVTFTNTSELEDLFKGMGSPLWIRARHGAGGRLSLACDGPQEARDWVELWLKRGVHISEFMLQEYLPGRNIAWDSIWKDGALVTSYSRERLEYPFKHISPSGITGTPSVSRIIKDGRINRIAELAVKAVTTRPDGAFSVDIKEDPDGRPMITEVDGGKFHSTMPLWGYIAVKHLRLPPIYNLADLYVKLGMGDEVPSEIEQHDFIPDGYYMIRNIDSGVLLWREDGFKERIL